MSVLTTSQVAGEASGAAQEQERKSCEIRLGLVLYIQFAKLQPAAGRGLRRR